MGKKTRKNAFILFTAISQPPTRHLPTCAGVWGLCMGVYWAIEPIGDAKQAMSEGKSGPVGTGLTWPAAMALTQQYQKIIWSPHILGRLSACANSMYQAHLHFWCTRYKACTLTTFHVHLYHSPEHVGITSRACSIHITKFICRMIFIMMMYDWRSHSGLISGPVSI